MTVHPRIVAVIVAYCVVASSLGCTSMTTIRPVTDPAAPPFGKVKAGDTVRVETRDGRQILFIVERIDGDALVSQEGTRYTRGDIVRLERRAMSGWTKGIVIAGTVVGFMALVLLIQIGEALGDLGG